MKTIKFILTALLMIVAFAAQAQTIQFYKDGAVVKEYDAAAVDSIVYKPAAAQPRYYYYAGWTQPSESNLADLVAEADGVKAYGVTKDTNVGFNSSRPFAIMPNTLTDREWAVPNNQKRYQYVVVPSGMKIYDADDITVEIVTYNRDTSISIKGHDVYKSNKVLLASAKFAAY